MKFHVIIACNQFQETFIKQEFPSITTVFLPGYDISYRNTKSFTRLFLFLQVPKILMAIKRENLILRQFLYDHSIDLVISDNRYGLHSDSVPCVLITHQLAPFSGIGSWVDRNLSAKLARYINRFQEVWIPDTPDSMLSGQLSGNQEFINIPVRYLGPVSRLNACSSSTGDSTLIILSGPEPQRTIFETLVLKTYVSSNRRTILIRGTHTPLSKQVAGDIKVIDVADSATVNRLACGAEIIISRSGYTSLMDMVKLKKKWIVVPTPGQAEQEYLARHIELNGWGLAVSQQHFNCHKALSLVESFAFKSIDIDTEKFKEAIHDFLQR